MPRASRTLPRLLLAVALLLPLATVTAGPREDEACRELSQQAIRLLTEADQTGDVAAALRGAALLERAIVLCPDAADIAFQLTLAYVLAREEDKSRASLRLLEAILRRTARANGHPDTEVAGDPRLLYARARIAYTFGNNPRGALEDIERLRARDPKFLAGPVTSLEFRCRLAYATVLLKSKDVNEALRQTRLAIEVVRGDTKREDIARRNLGQILRVADRWIEAQQEFEKLLERYPRDAVLRYALASVLADQMKFDEALGQWRQVLELAKQPDTVDPRERDQLADAPMRYGVTLLNSGRFEEGKRQLLEYAKENERDARVWFYLGKAAVEHFDDPDAAVEWLEKARALDPWCERTLRLLFELYTGSRKDEGRAKVLGLTLDSKEDKEARKKEMDRRIQVRSDGMTGCD